MQVTTAQFSSNILVEMNDITIKTNANVYTNGNNEITAAMVNAVFMDIKDSINSLMVDIRDSYFNLLSNTTNDIIEGNNPDKWFFSLTHFLWRLQNNATTDNLPEGTTNLYYTQSRVDARINSLRPTQSTVPPPTSATTVSILDGNDVMQTI